LQLTLHNFSIRELLLLLLLLLLRILLLLLLLLRILLLLLLLLLRILLLLLSHCMWLLHISRRRTLQHWYGLRIINRHRRLLLLMRWFVYNCLRGIALPRLLQWLLLWVLLLLWRILLLMFKSLMLLPFDLLKRVARFHSSFTFLPLNLSAR
jgi:hypothetical protein